MKLFTIVKTYLYSIKCHYYESLYNYDHNYLNAQIIFTYNGEQLSFLKGVNCCKCHYHEILYSLYHNLMLKFCYKKVLTGASVWDRKCDVWCLGALLLEWNLENYM